MKGRISEWHVSCKPVYADPEKRPRGLAIDAFVRDNRHIVRICCASIMARTRSLSNDKLCSQRSQMLMDAST